MANVDPVFKIPAKKILEKKFVILVRILTSLHKENPRKKFVIFVRILTSPHKGLCEDARTFFLKKIASPGLLCNPCEDPHKYYKGWLCEDCEDPRRSSQRKF